MLHLIRRSWSAVPTPTSRPSSAASSTSTTSAGPAPTHRRELTLKAHDADGRLVAGLSGWTWGTCAAISMVWVREDQRGEGWGTRLMAAAEDEARNRGCERAAVSSFTFQAPGFYQRLGYVETGRTVGIPLEECDDVHLTKPL